MPEDARLKELIAKHTPLPKRKRKSNDGGILPALVKRAAELGTKLWRNNVGTLQDKRGNYVSYGLCIGSSDLIGYTVRTITAADVGTQVAIFTSIEAKAQRGTATDKQVAWIGNVRADGGIAQIVRSVSKLEYTLKGMK